MRCIIMQGLFYVETLFGIKVIKFKKSKNKKREDIYPPPSQP